MTEDFSYSSCRFCPRACGTERDSGRRGYCGETADVRIAWAGLHRGEEPPVSGERGSGTVFFTGCTLHCAFCQNRQISREGVGAAISTDELAAVFLALERRGALNVNLVTATPFVPSVVEAAKRARRDGLTLPLLWNSSGYETVEAVDRLAGTVSVWLPDLKSLDPAFCRSMFGAPDYPDMARAAILRMAEQAPLSFEGAAVRSGVILRHLALPGRLEDTREVLAWYRERLQGRALLSLMFQYLPVPGDERGPERTVTEEEYDRVFDYLDELGVDDGFVQERNEAGDWLPDFTRNDPFPPSMADAVWTWRVGWTG